MTKYNVVVTTNIVEIAVVDVDAESTKHAAQLAEDIPPYYRKEISRTYEVQNTDTNEITIRLNS